MSIAQEMLRSKPRQLARHDHGEDMALFNMRSGNRDAFTHSMREVVNQVRFDFVRERTIQERPYSCRRCLSRTNEIYEHWGKPTIKSAMFEVDEPRNQRMSCGAGLDRPREAPERLSGQAICHFSTISRSE